MENTDSEFENGGVKLPIGFRFHPTDDELVAHYLKRKICSLSLPANVIPEFEVFQSNPWDLPGDLNEKRYFFTKRKLNIVNKCGSNLTAGCGYWRANGKDKPIVAPGSNMLIGIKKSSVFYKGKNSHGSKTQWIMKEFSLVGSVITPCLSKKLMIQVGDWVVCRVYQRKRKTRNNVIVSNIKKSMNLQPNNELGFSAISSPCSSGVTEISSNDLDQEASSYNF